MSTPPPVYTPIDRDEVITYLGPAWPVPATATTLTLAPGTVGADGQPFTDGAVAVFPLPAQPGRTWWCVDGSIPPQSTGTPDQALADLLPGSTLVVPPPPDTDPTPPQT